MNNSLLRRIEALEKKMNVDSETNQESRTIEILHKLFDYGYVPFLGGAQEGLLLAKTQEDNLEAVPDPWIQAIIQNGGRECLLEAIRFFNPPIAKEFQRLWQKICDCAGGIGSDEDRFELSKIIKRDGAVEYSDNAWIKAIIKNGGIEYLATLAEIRGKKLWRKQN